MRVSNSFVRFILVAHFSIKTVSLICLVASTLAKAVLATKLTLVAGNNFWGLFELIESDKRIWNRSYSYLEWR